MFHQRVSPMKPPSTGQILKSKVHHADTIVDWDEFAKLVNVGETFRSGGTDLVISKKVYEETSDGFKISIHAIDPASLL